MLKYLNGGPSPCQIKAIPGYERNHEDFLAVIGLMDKREGREFIKAYYYLITHASDFKFIGERLALTHL